MVCVRVYTTPLSPHPPHLADFHTVICVSGARRSTRAAGEVEVGGTGCGDGGRVRESPRDRRRGRGGHDVKFSSYPPRAPLRAPTRLRTAKLTISSTLF